MAINILLIEEDEALGKGLQTYFKKDEFVMEWINDSNAAITYVHQFLPEVIILSNEISELDKDEICKNIRKHFHIPIIFISNASDLKRKLQCFKLGGDDFLTIPFHFEELEARIRAVVRRYQQENQKPYHIIRSGNLSIHLNTYECFIEGELISLTAKEMQLLLMLAKRPNQVFSAEQIFYHVWGYHSGSNIETVKVHIRNLRSKLKGKERSQYIATVRGFGYRFITS